MIKIAVVGFGYWGPNIVRNFLEIDYSSVKYICDTNEKRLRIAKEKYPFINCTKEFKQVLRDKDIDLVAIITPVSTHYRLASGALQADKHVLIAKPITKTVRECEKLLQLSEKKKLILMVDHTYVYTQAVKKIKEYTDSRLLGKLLYFDSVRINLGLIQPDVNVIWDLAPHDLSIMDYCINAKVKSVSAHGAFHYGNRLEELAYVHIELANGIMANFHFNWLSPVKIRHIIIGGTKKMLVFNDLNSDEKIKIYNRGIKMKNNNEKQNKQFLIEYRIGDMFSPRLYSTEALKTECLHLIDCIRNNRRPITDGTAGLHIVEILEACNKSLRKDGEKIKIT